MSLQPLHLQVECAEREPGRVEPVRFEWGEKSIGVEEILDRWPAPGHRYYKVRAGDGGIYLLRHDESGGYWELVLFDSGSREETKLSST